MYHGVRYYDGAECQDGEITHLTPLRRIGGVNPKPVRFIPCGLSVDINAVYDKVVSMKIIISGMTAVIVKSLSNLRDTNQPRRAFRKQCGVYRSVKANRKEC